MEENLYNRIGEADLNPTYKDGQVYQHTDVNNMLSILKLAINENYYDIQRLWNGERSVGNADKLDGATLSRYLNEELQPNDNKVPSSQQVMSYINSLFEDFSPPIRGVDYWTEEDKTYIIDETANRIIEEVKGEYDANTTYEKLNIVFYQGSTYFALQQTTGNLPTDTDYWQLLAKRGDSAYEIYQKHGGTLPEDVWLDEFTNAENFYNKVEVDNKLSLRDLLIAQKVYYFDTVAAMKAYNLNVGECVITKGYYQINDGGAGEYEIVNDNTLIDDGGSVHELLNGFYAKLITKDNPINVKQFGAKGDGVSDDTNKIQSALNYCFDKGIDLEVSSTNEYYKITRPLILKATGYGLGDAYWAGNGTRFYGKYKNHAKIIKIGNATSGITDYDVNATIICQSNNGTGIHIENLTIANFENASMNSYANNSYAVYTKCSRSNYKDLNLIAYHGMYASSFSSNFENIVLNCVDTALEIVNGTSNTLRFIYAPACNNPYKISSSYTTLMNCASDQCKGTIYRLSGVGLTLLNCGCESRNAQYIFEQLNVTWFNVTVQGMMIDRQVGDPDTSLSINDCAIFHIQNTGSFKLRDVTIIEREAITDGNSYVFKLDSDNVRMNTVIDNLSYDKNYIGNNNTRMKLWNGFKTEGYTPHTYSSGGLTFNYQLTGQGVIVPFIGGFQGAQSGELSSNAIIDEKLFNKAIYFDTEDRYTIHDDISMQYQARPNLGDLHIFNDPLAKNAFGNVVTKITNSSNYSLKKVPIVLDVDTENRPTTNLYTGLCIYDTTLKKPIWYDGASHWRDSSGSIVN